MVTHSVPWMDLESPTQLGPLLSDYEFKKTLHGRKTSVLLRISRGNLELPIDEAVAGTEWTRALPATGGSRDSVQHVVSFLEESVREGPLRGAYITGSILSGGDDGSLLGWNVGPNSIYVSRNEDEKPMRLTRNLTNAALARLGAKIPAGFGPHADLRDKVSSLFCVGTADGYDLLEFTLEPQGCCVLLDRGGTPFDDHTIASLDDLFRTDAGWHYGLRAHGIAVGLRAELAAANQTWSVSEIAESFG